MNEQRKKSALSFIWPYLIMLILVGSFVWITFGSSGNKTESTDLTQIANILYNEEVLKVTVTKNKP